MRVEAPERPLGLQAGRNDCPIHIQSQTTQAGMPDRVSDQVIVDPKQAVDVLLSKSTEPAAERSRGGQSREAREPEDQRVVLEVEQVLHPSSAADQQSQNQQDHGHYAIVSTQTRVPEVPTNPRRQIDRLEVAPNQLEARVRREPLGLETEPKIAVDPEGKTCFA
jgi:hypothetical protein